MDEMHHQSLDKAKFDMLIYRLIVSIYII